MGSHSSYAQGFYDGDNYFYLRPGKISRDKKTVEGYLNELVYGVDSRKEYISKLGDEYLQKLKMKEKWIPPLNYGSVIWIGQSQQS
ncbi:MAG: hypothetical protein QXW80_04405 [Candidatus Micrarchaeia archaeon]